jgi:hypothetical protein
MFVSILLHMKIQFLLREIVRPKHSVERITAMDYLLQNTNIDFTVGSFIGIQESLQQVMSVY